MSRLCDIEINGLLNRKFECGCGRTHSTMLKSVKMGSGAIRTLPEVVHSFGAENAYIVCDNNTYKAAGEKVEAILRESGIMFKTTVLKELDELVKIEPCEKTVGSAVMGFVGCGAVIGIGGGTINDICKFIALLSNLPYIIVASAPSMDGYASNSSSMLYNGVKSTIYTDCADVIICDTDILCNAPKRMMQAGIGDMAAKYISVCEWRISNLINGEYYCNEIADMMRSSARKCVQNAEAFMNGDEKAVKNVIEGLILAGMAMSFANTSRPASGVEHYYSHLWEMRAIERGERSDLHGIQVGAGVLLALEKYEKLRKIVPDREKAVAFVDGFDIETWKKEVREYFGKSAESIIALEEKEHKFARAGHAERLDRIISKWDDIIAIVNEELPSADYIRDTYDKISFPYHLEEIGETASSAEEAFVHTKDIRDKYILSRLLWDIGEINEQTAKRH